MNVDIETVTQIIREVSAARIMPRWGKLRDEDIAFKKEDDPVTIADKEAESDLSNRFLDLLPGSKVVGEEGFALNSAISGHFFSESPVWIIDPVDGTRNFAAGSPKFGTIVALAERNQLVAGWIYSPTSDEVVTVERGAGAWYKGKRLKTQPPASLAAMHGVIGKRMLKAHALSEAMKNRPSPYFERTKPGVFDYPDLIIDTPHFGDEEAPKWHFRASRYHMTPWDDAAGALMHAEAGGYSAHWDGTPFNVSAMHNGLLLAPNKESWHELKNWCDAFCTFPIDWPG